MLWWQDAKYIMNFADIDELYDLAQDPAEMNNLATKKGHAKALREMRLRLLEARRRCKDNLGPQHRRFFERGLMP